MNVTDLEIHHDTDEHRFWADVDGGRAVLDYEPVGEDKLDYQHTFTPPEARGHGIARAIVKHALRYADEQGKEVIPTCPFVRKVLEEEDAA